MKPRKSRRLEVSGEAISDKPVIAVEIIVNGKVVHRITPTPRQNRDAANVVKFHQAIELTGSSWLVVRCWEPRDSGRVRFAHTAPWFFDVPGAPLRPHPEEIDSLIRSVKKEIERSSGVLPAEAVAEYHKALAIYEDIARNAR